MQLGLAQRTFRLDVLNLDWIIRCAKHVIFIRLHQIRCDMFRVDFHWVWAPAHTLLSLDCGGVLPGSQPRFVVTLEQPYVGFPDWCERARCTARTIPFLGFFLAFLTSLHSRYICSILIVFIHCIGSLASHSTPSVCLTSSPRPNDIPSICLSSSSSIRLHHLFHHLIHFKFGKSKTATLFFYL